MGVVPGSILGFMNSPNAPGRTQLGVTGRRTATLPGMAPISFRAGVAKRCLAIEHELIHNMRIWQSYNPPLSDQQTEIALERH